MFGVSYGCRFHRLLSVTRFVFVVTQGLGQAFNRLLTLARPRSSSLHSEDDGIRGIRPSIQDTRFVFFLVVIRL